MVNQLPLMFGRKGIAGSHIGGIAASEELMELCCKAKIFPDVQLIEAKDL